ncbi:MAG: hypothetical protein ABH854_02895 [Candidatus Diapherotrites archaeon]|nr:hypothetical protein [Candidatus Micrarchaeota archaeon]MBU1939852.1 hypothetical protein [Candidatus Micrarchaeota archaeon]
MKLLLGAVQEARNEFAERAKKRKTNPKKVEAANAYFDEVISGIKKMFAD